MYQFTNINNQNLSITVNCSDKQFSHGTNDLNLSDISVVLNPPENLTNLFNQFNIFFSDQK